MSKQLLGVFRTFFQLCAVESNLAAACLLLIDLIHKAVGKTFNIMTHERLIQRFTGTSCVKCVKISFLEYVQAGRIDSK